MKTLDWLQDNVHLPRWLFYALNLLIWYFTLTNLWAYFTISRPIDQCMEARQPLCTVEGKSVHIVYRSHT